MIRKNILLVLAVAWTTCGLPQKSNAQTSGDSRPNVILIMTDDQGIGDLGVMGNPVIKTPNIDALAHQSAWLVNFYVHPVCTPTRACLMTGRYNYRTRAIDTYIGRAMMEPQEVTVAEVLGNVGYATGIFGKWHLGDCYPMRGIDQGFQQAVVHRGGGIGQPSDPKGAEAKYTDPILFRNGKPEQFQGYCTDIYYDEAMSFIDESNQAGKPFFVYLPDNCPHGPFGDVPQALYQQYKQTKLDADQFPQQAGHPIPPQKNVDVVARIFAMISNVDRNVGRLLEKLDRLSIVENTIVIFMCDNGPNTQRYVMGLRGKKSDVYEGGIRAPFFMRWPARIESDKKIDQVAAHIDVMPTLLACCQTEPPAGLKLDGRNLLPLLTGETEKLPDREIVIQTHRGNQPTRYHHFAIRNQNWKLVHSTGFGREQFNGDPQFELYDMNADPLEMKNVAEQNSQVVDALKKKYDAWFDDVSSTRAENYAPPRIVIDPPDNSPIVLTRQDWRRNEGKGWGAGGQWLVSASRPGTFRIRIHLLPRHPRDSVELRAADTVLTAKTDQTNLFCEFDSVRLPAGDFAITAVSSGSTDAQATEPQSAYQIEILK